MTEVSKDFFAQVNDCKNGLMHQFRPDMHQSFMVHGNYTNYTSYDNKYKPQSQRKCYVHQASMMVDHCTQHEQNPLIHLRYITTNVQNLWKKGHKCYILAQSQGIFYTHQAPYCC